MTNYGVQQAQRAEALEEALASAQTALAEIQPQYDGLKRAHHEQVKMTAAASQEIARLKRRVDQLQAEKDEADRVNRSLREQLTTLTGQLANERSWTHTEDMGR